MRYEIVGIAGTSASGKDTAGEHLAKQGYLHLATGSIVQAEAQRLYGTTDQYVCRQVAHEMRQRNGAGALCLAAIEQYKREKDLYRGVVITGIRALLAAQTIKNNEGLLISLNAPTEIRFQRLIERGRLGESTSLEEFIKFEEDEMSGTLDTGQNVGGIQEIADLHIDNSSADLVFFTQQIDRAVGLGPVA